MDKTFVKVLICLFLSKRHITDFRTVTWGISKVLHSKSEFDIPAAGSLKGFDLLFRHLGQLILRINGNI